MLERLKGLLGQGSEPEPQGDTHFIYIHLPELLEPDERDARYADPLDAELQIGRFGFVSGGGALFEAPDENGHRAMIYCGVDVDVYDLDAGRALLRVNLPELGCVAGTLLQFSDVDGDWQDAYDGASWTLRLPRPGPRDDHA